MSNRREFLSGAGSLIALSVAAPLRQAALAAPAAAAAAPAETTARLDALFEVFMDERLSKSPQQLTSLGLDKDRYAWARAQLNDASLARQQAAKLENASRLKRLRAFGRGALHGPDLANYDTVEFQMQTVARAAPLG